MIDVRIICTHDGAQTAQALARLLAAEEHRVEVCCGRAADAAALAAARGKREAVLLVWTQQALTASYFLDWARDIPAERLVEIVKAPHPLQIEGRKNTVLDFSKWSSERGGGAWRALVERLRTVARACEPVRPAPVRAAVTLGAASAMALGAALAVRLNDAMQTPTEPAPATNQMAAAEAVGQGGPLLSVEPASFDDEFHPHTRFARVAPLSPAANVPLATPSAPLEAHEFRGDSLLDRLGALARPLLSSNDRDPDDGQGAG